jgi:glycosyltransferase involved in cell wall biosynthesis
LIRIGFISHSPHLAGAEKVLANTVRQLSEKWPDQLEIHLYVWGKGPLVDALSDSQVIVHSLERAIPWYIGDNSDWRPERFFRATFDSRKEFKERFIRDGIQVVVINTMTVLAPLLAAADLTLPSLLWIHGIIDSFLLKELSKTVKPVLDLSQIRASTAVMTPSEWTRNLYAQYRSDIEILHNFTAVPSNPLPFQEGPMQFVCLNTWERFKGIDILIEAADMVRQKNQNFQIHLYGDGIDKQHIQALIESRSIGSHVVQHGRTRDIRAAFASSHALLTASKVESFGMTLIEALSYGRPIIVSRTSGHLEVMSDQDGHIGYYCDPYQPEDFAKRMLELIEDRQKVQKMGKAGHAYVTEKFNGDRTLLQLKKTLESLEDTFRNRRDQVQQRYEFLSALQVFDRTSSSLMDQIEALPQPISNPDLALDVAEKVEPVLIKTSRNYVFKSEYDVLDHFEVAIGVSGKEVSGTLQVEVQVPSMNECARNARIDFNMNRDGLVRFKFKPIQGIYKRQVQVKLKLNSEDRIHVYEIPKPPSLMRRVARKVKSKLKAAMK